jgi:hypothetical protein
MVAFRSCPWAIRPGHEVGRTEVGRTEVGRTEVGRTKWAVQDLNL